MSSMKKGLPAPPDLIAEVFDELLRDRLGSSMAAKVIQNSDDVDVKSLRDRLGLTLVDFSERYGFSVHTLKKWENKTRSPDTGAKLVLKMIEHNSQRVDELYRLTAAAELQRKSRSITSEHAYS